MRGIFLVQQWDLAAGAGTEEGAASSRLHWQWPLTRNHDLMRLDQSEASRWTTGSCNASRDVSSLPKLGPESSKATAPLLACKTCS